MRSVIASWQMHTTKHRYWRLFWQWDGWCCPEAEGQLSCQTEQEQCMYHWHSRGKELQWTQGSNYVYVVLCIHIHREGWELAHGTVCPDTERERERGVGKEVLCSRWGGNTVNLTGRESTCSHLCGEEENLGLEDDSARLPQGSHSGPYTWVQRNEGSGLEKATVELVGGDQWQEFPQLGQSTKKPVMENVGTSEDFFCNLRFFLLLFFFFFFFFAHMLHW